MTRADLREEIESKVDQIKSADALSSAVLASEIRTLMKKLKDLDASRGNGRSPDGSAAEAEAAELSVPLARVR